MKKIEDRLVFSSSIQPKSMTVNEVMKELESYGSEQTKKTFLKHGAIEPFFGVKVGDMKNIVKKVKKDHSLSMDLYRTGNGDAMYLAGLIADEKEISKSELEEWVKNAHWSMISEYTVPWVAAESPYGYELALKWIESDKETIASAGWATLSSLAGYKEDEDLDLEMYSNLLDRVEKEIHNSKNRVRYTMNGFIIATGAGIKSLTKKANKVGAAVGKVSVEMGETACKVPLAVDYIKKIADRGSIGKKRKTTRC